MYKVWRVVTLDTPAVAFSAFEGVVDQWHTKQASHPLPRWRDYEISDFAGWYGWVSLYRIDLQARDVFAELFGSNFAEAVGFDITGKSMRDPASGVYPSYAERTFSHLSEVITKPGFGVRFFSLAALGRDHVAGRIIDLPIAKNGDEATHVVSFMKPVDDESDTVIP